MVTFFLSILGSLVAGYLTILSAFMLLMLLITRLGRKVLMRDNGISPTYIVLLWCTWLMASLAGASVCAGLAPLAPYGPVALPCVLAVVTGLLLFRETRQVPLEHSVVATAGSGAMVLTGTVGALYLRHAL